MLKTASVIGDAIWKASSLSVNMNEALDLGPGQVLGSTQEDMHIHLDDQGEDLSELRKTLDAIDNTQNYAEVLLFNSFRREDPSISLAEQVHRFKKAVSRLPSRIIDLSADTEQGDFRDLPRSLMTNKRIDEDGPQELHDIIGEAGSESCREDTCEDEHQQERRKSWEHSNFLRKKAVTKARANHEGVRRGKNLSVRADGPSDLSMRTTDIKIADPSPSMPGQASIQEQAMKYDRPLKTGSQEEVTRAAKTPTAPLLGVQVQEDGVVRVSVGRSTTRVGDLK